jgi:iron complex transport system permease protein
VPHIARRVLGANAQHALPGAILLGGAFAVACDDVGRGALAGEIPLGILTALIGALVFVAMMVSRGEGRWQR